LDKSKFYGVDVVQSFSSDELSNAIGKSNRKVIAIKDKGFADKMKSLLL
jgi:ribosomal protein L7Ae-like RNA K-turn-binding protein